MKYFTKEWYDEMQVSGFLTFPETEQSEEAGLLENSSEIYGNDLEEKKKDLLKFLPESFHSYINSGTINSGTPTPELREMAGKWETDYEARVDMLLDDYSRHYESIKGSLLPGAVQLTEKSLHNCTVKKVERPSPDVLLLYLDCKSGFHYFKDIQVTFTGVTEVVMPHEFIGSWWLYNEICLKNDHFELHVLFDSPITEVTIVCKDVQITELE